MSRIRNIGHRFSAVIAETVIYPSFFLFRVHDRVMCEATYNATMPFKWNATKVQVMPGGGGGAGLMASQVSYLSI
jgi:hypothetical protein